MPIQDSAIVYKTKIKEARIYIEKLERIGFDVSKTKNEIDIIETETENKVDQSCDKYNNALGVETLLMLEYTASITKIDEIISNLKRRWDTYRVIDNECNSIFNSLRNTDRSNIDNIINDTIKLIDRLRYSSTIDYDLEEKLVNKTYKIVYEVLQFESLYSEKQKLIDKVSSNSTDSTHVYELLIKDLKNVDSLECKKILNDIERLPLNVSNFIDKRLLFLVALHNNPETINENKERFLALANEFLVHDENSERLKDRQIKYEYALYDKRQEIKRARIFFAKKIPVYIAGAGLVTLIMTASIKGMLNEKENYPTYDTITTTYDSETGNIEVKNSTTNDKDEEQYIDITKYSAWEPTKSYYKRMETYYKVTGDDVNYDCDYDECISKYVTKEYQKFDRTTYYDYDEPSDYKEDKYIIKKHTVDYNSSTEERETSNAKTHGIYIGFLCSAIFLVIFKNVYYLLSDGEKDEKISIKKYKSLKNDYKLTHKSFMLSKKDNLNSIEEEKQKAKRLKKEALDLYEKLDDSVKDSKEVEKVYTKVKPFL